MMSQLQQVIEELATTAKAQHSIINNFAKLQEKGIIIQAPTDLRGATLNF
jgi:hypothetical protein